MKPVDEKDKKSKEFIQGYIDLLEFKDPEKGEVDKLSKYKAIFAKSFFNVEEKPISDEDKKLYEELNKMSGGKITPVGELDYSKAKIPKSQEEYKEAYERATRAVEKEFDKINFQNKKVSNEKKQELKDKIFAISKKSLLDHFKVTEEKIGNKLGMFDNGAVLARRVVKVKSDLGVAQEVAQNQAQVLSHRIASLQSPENAKRIEKLGLAELVIDLSKTSDSINERLASPHGAGNQTLRQAATPSTSPREPKASCLSGMFKAIANIKTPQFLQSIFGKLRSNSGDSKGGGGR